jgi:hypothetical protein
MFAVHLFCVLADFLIYCLLAVLDGLVLSIILLERLFCFFLFFVRYNGFVVF